MDEVVAAVVVAVTFIVIVLGWRLYTGHYPASKFIVEDPPIAHNGLDSNQAKFMFFYTSWCPYSHKAWIPWKAFKQELKNNPVKYGGKRILLEEIDAEADKGKAALYKIREYPTFKLEVIDKVYTLQAVPDVLTFNAFLLGALGKKGTS